MEIVFYGVRFDTEKVLMKLLFKAYENDGKSCLCLQSKEEIEFYDAKLWSGFSWFPHCILGEGREISSPLIIFHSDSYAELQVIYSIDYLFVFNLAKHSNLEQFKKIYIVFDVNDRESLLFNRERWKSFRENNYNLLFYKQNESGKFDKTNM